MDVDPFFDVNFQLEHKNNSLDSNVGVIGFFLCSFDAIKGLQVLFAFPSSLSENQNEVSILKTHCIWKLDDIPIRIDLKFSEFVYSAFQLHFSLQQEQSASNDVVYGIILKLWKDNNPIDSDAIYNLKTQLEEKFCHDFPLIYKSKQLESNPVMKRTFTELQPKIREIERNLIAEWQIFKENLMKKVQTTVKPIIPSSVTDFAPSDAGVCAKDFFKDRIKLRVHELDENPQNLLVVLENPNEDLFDVKIVVSKSSAFFGETIWEETLDNWPMKEDLILEFDKGSESETYLIKISSRNSTIAIKSIEINNT